MHLSLQYIYGSSLSYVRMNWSSHAKLNCNWEMRFCTSVSFICLICTTCRIHLNKITDIFAILFFQRHLFDSYGPFRPVFMKAAVRQIHSRSYLYIGREKKNIMKKTFIEEFSVLTNISLRDSLEASRIEIQVRQTNFRHYGSEGCLLRIGITLHDRTSETRVMICLVTLLTIIKQRVTMFAFSSEDCRRNIEDAKWE